jgi:hypothetical protein
MKMAAYSILAARGVPCGMQQAMEGGARRLSGPAGGSNDTTAGAGASRCRLQKLSDKWQQQQGLSQGPRAMAR